MAKQAIIFPGINVLAKHFLVVHWVYTCNVLIPASHSSTRLDHKLRLEKHPLKIKLTSCSPVFPCSFCGFIAEKEQTHIFLAWFKVFRSQWRSFSGYGWAQSHFFTWGSFKLKLPTERVLQYLSSLPVRNLTGTVVFMQCLPGDLIFWLLHDA